MGITGGRGHQGIAAAEPGEIKTAFDLASRIHDLALETSSLSIDLLISLLHERQQVGRDILKEFEPLGADLLTGDSIVGVIRQVCKIEDEAEP